MKLDHNHYSFFVPHYGWCLGLFIILYFIRKPYKMMGKRFESYSLPKLYFPFSSYYYLKIQNGFIFNQALLAHSFLDQNSFLVPSKELKLTAYLFYEHPSSYLRTLHFGFTHSFLIQILFHFHLVPHCSLSY